MGKKEKLLRKLFSVPKDFSFQELESLMGYYSYRLRNKGKTSGSRVAFVHDSSGSKLLLHKPHQSKYLLSYQVKDVIQFLVSEGLV